MALKTTRWTNDHCGCVVEYDWDDSIPDSSRTHTPSNLISACPAHTGLQLAQLYTAVLDENTRKNKVVGNLLSNVAIATTTTTPDGLSTTITMKAGVTITWVFDANRVLTVTITGISQNIKNQIQSWCDTNIGAGKVAIK